MSAKSLESLKLLRGPEGGVLLARILDLSETEAAAPSFVASLRKNWPAELVSLALRVAEARRRAGRKFPEAKKLWFTPELLEQASSHPCALHPLPPVNSIRPLWP